MAITTLPVQNEETLGLGQSKSDARPYTQPATQISADIWNKTVLRVIEAFGEIGKTDGSTSGSLNARVKLLEESAPQSPEGNLIQAFSDLLGAANGGEGWQWFGTGDNPGEVVVAASLSHASYGFDSNGVAVLASQAGGDFDGGVLFVRGAHGVNCDSTVFPVIEFRIFRPQTADGDEITPAAECLAFVGLAADFGDDGPDKAIGFAFDYDGTAKVFTTTGGGFESATVNSCSGLPSAQALNVRLTIGIDSSVVEVSDDNGKNWVTVCTTSIPAAQMTYLPIVGLETKAATGTGPRFFSIDWVKTTSVRSGDGASPFDGENSLKFPNPVKFGDDPVEIADSSNDEGSKQFAARSDHQHSHGERGGGSLHAVAVAGDSAGFMSAADKTKLDLVNQPFTRSAVTGPTDTIVAADVGGVVFYTDDCTVALPDLSGSLGSGHAMVLTLQQTTSGKRITVDPGTSVTIDGSTSNYLAAVGLARVVLVSQDGLAWFSGTP